MMCHAFARTLAKPAPAAFKPQSNLRAYMCWGKCSGPSMRPTSGYMCRNSPGLRSMQPPSTQMQP